jgi:hypothetical protein
MPRSFKVVVTKLLPDLTKQDVAKCRDLSSIFISTRATSGGVLAQNGQSASCAKTIRIEDSRGIYASERGRICHHLCQNSVVLAGVLRACDPDVVPI